MTLEMAPTYHPTLEEFTDCMAYITKWVRRLDCLCYVSNFLFGSVELGQKQNVMVSAR